jgi:hypothetical protein
LEPSKSWSYGSWIYNYLCNQCLSPLTLWVQIQLRRGVLDTTLWDKVCQWLTVSRLFSPYTPVSSTNKTQRHDITDILLKVELNTINLNPNSIWNVTNSLPYHEKMHQLYENNTMHIWYFFPNLLVLGNHLFWCFVWVQEKLDDTKKGIRGRNRRTDNTTTNKKNAKWRTMT